MEYSYLFGLQIYVTILFYPKKVQEVSTNHDFLDIIEFEIDCANNYKRS